MYTVMSCNMSCNNTFRGNNGNRTSKNNQQQRLFDCLHSEYHAVSIFVDKFATVLTFAVNRWTVLEFSKTFDYAVR